MTDTSTKTKPILFSAPMVRALLNGRKTQTRRIMKPQPHPQIESKFPYARVRSGHAHWHELPDNDFPMWMCSIKCPYGKPGDRLWVRESFQPLLADDLSRYKPNYKTGEGYKVNYVATDGVAEFYDMATDRAFCSKVTPSIHMPLWASRITLQITGVRVEQLQLISPEHALAEGFASREDFSMFFKPAVWNANPWVWAVSFEVMSK